ncbi:hypothetical protein SODALDRAFT_362275 [Sodiomyces alkalinus F11]|uniref:Uncharacterized protein n=1 Tax=Sodiomyces alkalinus (strain CBS 110278 / VKM F-3762 / F11) TaxID=1314773 RepID=A0A3N2PPP0_SODAK|nr:hypothetical protein SODALDRAFT_362275 [Sodiomyces alkalinus F11]ROT36469.1 hypothetical protein SODALDRAFT_362275 [Sodiomyces alkalinus F11]
MQDGFMRSSMQPRRHRRLNFTYSQAPPGPRPRPGTDRQHLVSTFPFNPIPGLDDSLWSQLVSHLPPSSSFSQNRSGRAIGVLALFQSTNRIMDVSHLDRTKPRKEKRRYSSVALDLSKIPQYQLSSPPPFFTFLTFLTSFGHYHSKDNALKRSHFDNLTPASTFNVISFYAIFLSVKEQQTTRTINITTMDLGAQDKCHSGNASDRPKPTVFHTFISTTFALVAFFALCEVAVRGAFPFNHLAALLSSCCSIEFVSTVVLLLLFLLFLPSSAFTPRNVKNESPAQLPAHRRQSLEKTQDVPSSPSTSTGVQAGASFTKLTTSGGALCTRPRATCEAVDAMRTKEQAEVDRLDDQLWHVQLQITSAFTAKVDAEKRAALAEKRADDAIAAAKKEAEDRINRVIDDAQEKLKQIQAEADREGAAAHEKADLHCEEIKMKNKKIAELEEELCLFKRDAVAPQTVGGLRQKNHALEEESKPLCASSTTSTPPTPPHGGTNKSVSEQGSGVRTPPTHSQSNPDNQSHSSTPSSAKSKSSMSPLDDMSPTTKKRNTSPSRPLSFSPTLSTPTISHATMATSTKSMFEQAAASANKLISSSVLPPALPFSASAPAHVGSSAAGHGKSLFGRVTYPPGHTHAGQSWGSAHNAVMNSKAEQPMDGVKADWEDEDVDWQDIL